MGTIICHGRDEGLGALEVFSCARDGARLSRIHVGVAVGFIGGALAAVSGVGLAGAIWLGLVGGASGGLAALRTLLLISSGPLVVFGAHCLDLLEERIGRDSARQAREPAGAAGTLPKPRRDQQDRARLRSVGPVENGAALGLGGSIPKTARTGAAEVGSR